MCHQRDPTFSLAFTKIPPFLLTFTQWPPITERPRYIFVNQRPLIFAFYSQTSDRQFSARNWIFSTNLTKCWEIFGHERPLVLMHFTERPPYFCMLCERPFFDIICHRKTPTSERCLVAWLSYVTFICEFPPPGAHKPQISLEIFSSQAPKFGNFRFTSSIPQSFRGRPKYQFASPTLRKSGPHTPAWKKSWVPPPPDLYTCSGQYTIRALIAVALQVELSIQESPETWKYVI